MSPADSSERRRNPAVALKAIGVWPHKFPGMMFFAVKISSRIISAANWGVFAKDERPGLI